jgi:hypothetical protein
MIFRVELDIPERIPPPARFVFARVFGAPDPGGPRKLLGSISLDEDTARELAAVINGEPWPAREYQDPYEDGEEGEPA